jgi:hypothetical protein
MLSVNIKKNRVVFRNKANELKKTVRTAYMTNWNALSIAQIKKQKPKNEKIIILKIGKYEYGYFGKFYKGFS